jgi:nitrogen fixation protein NifB
MTLDISRHPCFNESAKWTFARVHLPVAPDCNVQCNFCHRKYDCANESRPGVTTAVLTPTQALRYLEGVVNKDPRIAVVGIAGPGDPFGSPYKTLETLRLVRARYPELLLCVASNGLNVARYAAELGDLEVSHVTLTINAVDPEIGAKVYSWVRDGKRMCRGLPAAELLWQRQKEAVGELKKQGVAVKINTIIVPGVNDGHAVEIARTVKDLGADIINCVPLYPVPGTPFAGIPSPDGETIRSIRAAASAFLPIMEHCTRCRADAVGLLGEKMPAAIELHLLHCAASEQEEPAEISTAAADPAARPHVAVATLEGVLVNQHLGEAMQFAVFTREKGEYRLVETRQAPPPGGAEQRWHALADTLHDCRALLVASAGESPRSALKSRGIRVLMMEGLIEEGLEAVYQGVEIRAPLRQQHRCGSGSGCVGTGMGCG